MPERVSLTHKAGQFQLTGEVKSALRLDFFQMTPGNILLLDSAAVSPHAVKVGAMLAACLTTASCFPAADELNDYCTRNGSDRE